jgi:hypothetical protein
LEDVEELNRLVGRGLPTMVALEVITGALNEEFEVTHWNEYPKAREWAAEPANRDAELIPQWDYCPSRFYLSLDGELPSSFDEKIITVIIADTADVVSHLHFGSDRSEGPWTEDYRSKTGGIAYRWANSLPVTPTFILCAGCKVAIDGSMHRFHLARNHNAKQMPFLVRDSELNKLLSILSSAKVRT